MKAYKIDIDGVSVVEGEYEELLERGTTWDSVPLDDLHYLKVDYYGAMNNKPTAEIGFRDTPLPAFIVCASEGGGGHADPKLDIDHVRSIVQWNPHPDALAVPAIGLDVMEDEQGVMHPWRIALAFPGECRQAIRRLIPLPLGTRYRLSTNHMLYGCLQDSPSSVEERTGEAIDILRARGCDRVVMSDRHRRSTVTSLLQEGGITIEWVTLAAIPSRCLDDPFCIGYEAGHEIAHLACPDLRDAAPCNPRSATAG